MYTYTVESHNTEEMINIDRLLQDAIEKSKIERGRGLIFIPHTTAAVTINENADPDVQRDMMYGLHKLVPNLAEFRHFEGNSTAHIKSSLVGVSLEVLIDQARPVFGTWQSLYFMEFDGPRKRKVIIDIKE